MVENSLTQGWEKPTIKVKFMHRGLRRGTSAEKFLRQFPNTVPRWDKCQFDFDLDCRDYDWLVVYHDLPKSGGFITEEKLNCPREKTLLITGEPSTITVFGADYLKQFGFILTFQEPWAIRHPNAIYRHPGLMWHYGLPFKSNKFLNWNQIAGNQPVEKTRPISTVCSQRMGNITLHSTRVKFTARLKNEIPELDIFGHGVKPMDDKAEALDSYQFHIAVENHVYKHHITEKLPDAFLGFTVPFYHGAPNASDYFPPESFIPIDINDYDRSRQIIQHHLNNKEYADRLPYIIEARRRVVEEQNLFSVLSSEIKKKDREITTTTLNKVIRNRSTMRIKNPAAAIRNVTEKALIKTYHRVTFKSRNKPIGLQL